MGGGHCRSPSRGKGAQKGAEEEESAARAAKTTKQAAEVGTIERGHENEEGGGREENEEETTMEGKDDEDTDMERLLGDEAVRGHDRDDGDLKNEANDVAGAGRLERGPTSGQEEPEAGGTEEIEETGETQPWTPPWALPLPAAPQTELNNMGGYIGDKKK